MNLSKPAILLLSSLLFLSCSADGISDTVMDDDVPVQNEAVGYEEAEGEWANENFDLLSVTNLLEKADDAAEFEKLINQNEGVNNLDLNGDGYVDYVSVEEFEDRDDNQRGFTLLTRFGPDDVQEIASIIFGRDRPDRRGATFYVKGNDQIYGDNYSYGGNWLDKSLAIASWAFGDRDRYYRSPYYYDNYPTYYNRYRVIRTPLYRQRVVKYQVNPAMTKITTPFGKIKIKSRYPGMSYRRAHAKMKKPTKAQLVFYKNKPKGPDFGNKKANLDDRPAPADGPRNQGRKDPGKTGDTAGKTQDRPDKMQGKPEAKNKEKAATPGKNDSKSVGKPDKGPGKAGPKSKPGGGKEKGKGGKPGKN